MSRHSVSLSCVKCGADIDAEFSVGWTVCGDVAVDQIVEDVEAEPCDCGYVVTDAEVEAAAMDQAVSNAEAAGESKAEDRQYAREHRWDV